MPLILKIVSVTFIVLLNCVDLSAQFKIKGIGIEYSENTRNTYLEQAPVYYRNSSDENIFISLYFDINRQRFQAYFGAISNGLDHYIENIRDISRVSRLRSDNKPTYETFGINYIRSINKRRFFDIDLLTGIGFMKLANQATPSITGGIISSSTFNTTADNFATTSNLKLGLDWTPFLKTRVEFIAKPIKFIELVSFIEYNYAFGLNLLEGSISTYRLSESRADSFDGNPNTTYFDDNVSTQRLDIGASNLGFGVMTRVKF